MKKIKKEFSVVAICISILSQSIAMEDNKRANPIKHLPLGVQDIIWSYLPAKDLLNLSITDKENLLTLNIKIARVIEKHLPSDRFNILYKEYKNWWNYGNLKNGFLLHKKDLPYGILNFPLYWLNRELNHNPLMIFKNVIFLDNQIMSLTRPFNSINLNYINSEGLIIALSKNPISNCLRLRDVTSKNIKNIMSIIDKYPKISSLDLSDNNIGIKGGKAIALALKNNSTIVFLNMACNHIKDEGTKVMLKVLKKNRNLTSLNLVFNDIGVNGAKEIALALKENKSITSLNLSDNNLKNEGAKALSEVLKLNNTILFVNLKYNIIGDEGAEEIIDMLKVNKTIKYLNLENNNITPKSYKVLKELIEEKRHTNAMFTIEY